jgi:hypothetical protein
VIPGIDVALPSRHAHLIISLDSPIEVLQMPSPAQRASRLRALVSGLQDAPAYDVAETRKSSTCS